MSVEIRPPLLSDWRACRMLLPESFGPGPPPEAFLAWDTERGALAGLVVFHRLHRETVRLQAITLRPFRRRGIGSALLRKVCERAVERGDLRIRARADLEKTPEAAPFLAAHGFAPDPSLIRIEGDLAPIRQTVCDLRDRLAAGGRIPPGARTIHSSQCRPEFLARLYEEMLAPAVGAEAALAGWAVSRPDFEAIVLLVGERPAGMVVGRSNDGAGTGLVDGLVVCPEYRGGWGWGNVLLIAAATDFAAASGARRIRFETLESNWGIRQHLERARGLVSARLAPFRRELRGL